MMCVCVYLWARARPAGAPARACVWIGGGDRLIWTYGIVRLLLLWVFRAVLIDGTLYSSRA